MRPVIRIFLAMDCRAPQSTSSLKFCACQDHFSPHSNASSIDRGASSPTWTHVRCSVDIRSTHNRTSAAPRFTALHHSHRTARLYLSLCALPGPHSSLVLCPDAVLLPVHRWPFRHLAPPKASRNDLARNCSDRQLSHCLPSPQTVEPDLRLVRFAQNPLLCASLSQPAPLPTAHMGRFRSRQPLQPFEPGLHLSLRSFKSRDLLPARARYRTPRHPSSPNSHD